MPKPGKAASGFAAVLFVFLAVAAAVSAGAAVRATPPALLAAINRARMHYGLRPLQVDPQLDRAAESYSAEMLRTGTFTHGAFQARMRAFHVPGPVHGENLAWGSGPYAAAATIVQEWLASPGHRANLLRRGFTRIGIGVASGTFRGQPGTVVVTADFSGV
jgi:uncharacterized protein YkwD